MESKNIKDYLHLYLGCECMIGDLNWKPETSLHGLAPGVDPNYGRPIKTKLDAHALNVYANQITLILRPLSDMTEEEAKEGRKMLDDMVADDKLNGEIEAARTVLLLSKHFDLFGLIESGLAIKKSH